MPLKTAALALGLGALLAALPSCTSYNSFSGASGGPIPGIQEGDEPGDVIAVLGAPKDRATGWWSSAGRFSPDYEVWFYKGTGRVIFLTDPEKRVTTSESDPEENGRSWGPR